MVLKVRKLTQSPIFHICLLFFLALSIRLPYLGTYLTIDEVKWMEGARQFAVTLFDGDLAQTYWHFFPGVTITWGEVLILWLRWLAVGKGSTLSEFVATQFADLDSLIGQMRLPAVFMTSLIIPGVYILARRLVGTTIALLGSILLIFNPFFLAHSRIVNGDASAAGFMLLSVLAFLWLWQGSELRLAALSGAMGGLAMLTKLPAPIIIPWVGVLALIGANGRRRVFPVLAGYVGGSARYFATNVSRFFWSW
jgi:predicted membrane-bound dolichyl-phosphate-mannose-protein mannosyltransferase